MKKLLYTLIALLLFVGMSNGSELSTLVAEHDATQLLLADGTSEIDTTLENVRGGVVNIYQGSWRTARCTTPDADPTTWTQAAHNVFSVSGPVIIHSAIGVCGQTLVGAGTIEFGQATAGTDLLIDQVADATALATNDVWCGVTTDVVLPGGAIGAGETFAFNTSTLEIVVGTANITDGWITFYVTYMALTATAKIDSVAWD